MASRGAVTIAKEPAPRKAKQALRQEDDHGDEDEPERDQIRKLLAEQATEKFAQQEEEPGADDRAEQRPDAAHDVEDHGLARHQEVDEIRRRETVLDRIEHAGETREQTRQHHRDDLVTLDRIADGTGARLVLAN